jgi:Cof subfamily protein (haloacid dehalogenase superfamily)
MATKKYLFFDIDGTLAAGGYGNTYVPESAVHALDKAREAGHFLCIATGRLQAMAVDYMHELGFRSMVSDGGYGVTIDDNFLGIIPLPKDKIVALVDECIAKGYPWALQTDNTTERTAPDSRFEDFTHDIYMKTRVVPGLDPRNFEELYKMYVACMPGEENELENLKALPWCRYQKEYIFVEPCDKAVGIKRVMDHFGADYKDAVVFGDALNDLSMFQDEWTKVAMGNAVPEIKALADYITTDVEDNGIYNACEALGLFEKAE